MHAILAISIGLREKESGFSEVSLIKSINPFRPNPTKPNTTEYLSVSLKYVGGRADFL